MDARPDVVDVCPGTPTTEELEEDKSLQSYTSLLTSLRNSLAKSSIGSLFVSYHASLQEHKKEMQTAQASQNDVKGTAPYLKTRERSANTVHMPTPPDSPLLISRRSPRLSMSDVKRALSGISHGYRRRSRSGSLASSPSKPSGMQPAARTRSRAHTVSSIAVSSSTRSTAASSTPPLTPDSTQFHLHHGLQYSHCDLAALESEDTVPRTREESQRIKEGKQPERPICYDALIDDISNESPTATTPECEDDIAVSGDSSEWFGLNYMLELSRRERRASDLEYSNTGEFSKSRESWILMHRGVVNPVFEDQEYSRWRKWHNALERQAEKRRIQRTFEFLYTSKELAEYYVNERRLREWLEWEKEMVADQGYLKLIKEDVAVLSSYRPDPYFPEVKHDIAWLLKHSRSVACLRELSPIHSLD